MSATDELLVANGSYAENFTKGGKPMPPAKKVAIVACMRKLLCIAVGVLNNQTAFDGKWQSTPYFSTS